MREYALIDPEARRVEAFRPTDDGHWKLYTMSDEPTLILSSISYGLAQREVFKVMDRQADDPA
jgi:Uma2 family endonuclease